MSHSWTIPASYTYDADTTIGTLLRVFMSANKAATPETLGAALGVRASIIERWMRGEPSVGLTSRYKAKFEEITGIDLDRLIVVMAKQEILRLLGNIQQVREENPSLAWLLQKDPALTKKINFGELPTREEMLLEIQEVVEGIEGGLVSLQMGLDNSTVNSWGKKQGHLPSGEALVRAIILLTIGFVRPSRGEQTGRDEIRYRVVAERVLGADPSTVIRAGTLKEALDQIFNNLDKYAISVIANKTGLTEPTAKRLLDWQPDGDRTSTGVILQVVRRLLQIHHPDKLEAFDLAAKEIQDKTSNQRVEHPVFWHGLDEQECGVTSASVRPVAPAEPEQALALDSLRSQEPPGRQGKPLATEIEPQEVPDMVSISFVAALATLTEALRLYPQLKARLPGELGTDSTPKTIPSKDLICDALRHSRHRHTQELERAVIERVLELREIMDMVCKWSPEVRSRVLQKVDEPLLAVADLFDAAGLADPQEFIRRMAPQQDAAGLVPKKP